MFFATTSGNFANSCTSYRSWLWDMGRILNIFSWLRLGKTEGVLRGHVTWNINMIPVSSTLKQVSFISMRHLTISWIICKMPRHWYWPRFVWPSHNSLIPVKLRCQLTLIPHILYFSWSSDIYASVSMVTRPANGLSLFWHKIVI